MQQHLNISKISAISNEFAKEKVTLCGREKTSELNRPYMYTNTLFPPCLHKSLLQNDTSRGIEAVRGAGCGFLPGPLPGRSVRIGLSESGKLTWSVLPGTIQSVKLPIGVG